MDFDGIERRCVMRPCQQCNAPVGNADKVCPVCGAAQQTTVGFQRPDPDTGEDTGAPLGAEPRRPDIVERLEAKDFDPRKIMRLCLLGIVLVVLIVALWNPTAALILGGACAVIVVVLMLVMG
jgi:hypothetical protein